MQGLRKLRPPLALKETYAQWLRAEADAVAAARAIAGESKWAAENVDPQVALAIAQGKAAGYARRLGAEACSSRPAGRMPG